MKIIVKPSDLIKRCIFTEYKKFVLKNLKENEIEELVKKDEYFELSEEDAYVIGLLKIIETKKLTHRLNSNLDELLNIRSSIQSYHEEEIVVVPKSIILNEILQFKNRFPFYFNPDTVYEQSLKDLNEYIPVLYNEIDKLDIFKIKNKNKTEITYILSKQVKKILRKT